MAHKSTYLSNKLLDHTLRNTSYTPPATVYVGLYSVAPTDAGGGTEFSGTGYARQSVAFSAASGSATSNTGLIDFGTAGSAWGTAVAAGLFDASSGGNLLYWNTITNKVVNSGDGVTIPIGDIDVAED